VSGLVVTPGERRKGELDGSIITHDGGIADYADLVVMPTLVLDRLRGKGMRVIWSA
jgi:hypothetical protein